MTNGVRPLPLTGAPHVVEFQPMLSHAVAPQTPWGVAEPLADLLPATTAVRVSVDDLEPSGAHPANGHNGSPRPTAEAVAAADAAEVAEAALRAANGRSLVLVVRDAHRHPWMTDVIRAVLAVRPDVIVVEMGLPASAIGGVHVATHGATRANGLAVAMLLAGVDPRH